jgi:hypothetical protein
VVSISNRAKGGYGERRRQALCWGPVLRLMTTLALPLKLAVIEGGVLSAIVRLE